MKLRFYARGRAKVTDPARPVVTGQVPQYVGREWVADKRAHVPTKTAYECEHASPVGARCSKMARLGDLWPADTGTAAAVGIAYTPVTMADGEWVANVTPVPVADIANNASSPAATGDKPKKGNS